MKMRKICAAVLAVCLVGGSMQGSFTMSSVHAEDKYITTDEGSTEVVVDSITYYVFDDHATLRICPKDVSGAIVIPDEVGGQPVTEIYGSAFDSCADIASVRLPDSITTIGKSAFIRCKALESINIPASLTTLESYAFMSCSALRSVSFNEGLEVIGENAFSDCKALEEVVFSQSINRINKSAFSNCGPISAMLILSTLSTNTTQCL